MKLTHEEAPMLEEITIEAPAEPLMQRAERILFGKRRPRTVDFADLCIDLYEHALSLEADARIKAANASAQMEDALQEAAQCWCDDETRGIVMDVRLAHAVARRIAGWRSCAAHHANGSDLYRGLLDKCAEHLGPAAYTADDGSVMLDPVRLKIPELVAAAVKGAPAGEPVEFKGLNGETIVGRMVK